MKTQLQILWVVLLCACQIESRPIQYGVEICHFCSMTVVDPSHAAQYVTSKGKNFTFDSIECMYREIQSLNDEPALILVADYLQPGTLIESRSATFLIHPDYPSPMGANLTAFSDSLKAVVVNANGKGTLYRWEKLELK